MRLAQFPGWSATTNVLVSRLGRTAADRRSADS
jgi:hypothetical protein